VRPPPQVTRPGSIAAIRTSCGPTPAVTSPNRECEPDSWALGSHSVRGGLTDDVRAWFADPEYVFRLAPTREENVLGAAQRFDFARERHGSESASPLRALSPRT
jgi:hypothetical protein